MLPEEETINNILLQSVINWCVDQLKALTQAVKVTFCKAKRHNKSEQLFGYPKQHPKCDIQNIDLRNPKHFVFLTCKHNITASFGIRKTSICNPLKHVSDKL